MTKREGGGTLPEALRHRLDDIVAEAAGEEKEEIEEVRIGFDAACALLDPYAPHAEAGAPDTYLRARTGVPAAQIVRWRRLRRIDRRGYARQHGVPRERFGALDLFGDSDHALSYTTASPVLGQWRPPEILLRVPLNYDALARMLYFLHHELPARAEDLAQAFGLTATDVEIAIELYARRLQETGGLCRRCGAATEQEYCMARCRRRR